MPEHNSPIHLSKHTVKIPYKWNEGGAGSQKEFKAFSGSRKRHGEKLLEQLRNAETEIETNKFTELGEDYIADKGFILTFDVDAEFEKNLSTFDSLHYGVELLNIIKSSDTYTASVFVKYGKLNYFIGRLEKYKDQEKSTSFIDPIKKIGLATIETLWTSRQSMPNEEESCWWEVWVRRGVSEDHRKQNIEAIKQECLKLGFKIKEGQLSLPEHTIILIKADKLALAGAYGILNCIAELRPPTFAKPTNTNLFDFSETPSALEPPSSPSDNAPSVCVLDTGVNYAHPLLSTVCNEGLCDSYAIDWGITDDSGHGTEMCGLVAHGDLLNASVNELEASHWVESVKLLYSDDPNDPQNYGSITVECMANIENKVPERSNRVFSMAVTAQDAPDFPYLAPDGLPTSWSAAIDSAVVNSLDPNGPHRVFVVSGGNISGFIEPSNYPSLNFSQAFEDPAQSWNAISVGAITNYAHNSKTTIAPQGGLSPYSRTTRAWTEFGDPDCPLKPEVVFEGGNQSNTGDIENLHPQTLNSDFISDNLFTETHATSAATSLAARMCARIHHSLPTIWPETVRALLINSARWNDQMKNGVSMSRKAEVAELVRTYGYGEASLERATSANTKRSTFFYEEEIQPFSKQGSEIKTKEMVFIPLPIPKTVLEEYANSKVKLYVTLSYFIEPNPGDRGLAKSKFRYANCGLRFDLKTATESLDTFIANRSGSVLEKLDLKKGDRGTPSKGWALGSDNRCRGSLHHDIWSGKASDLASRDAIIIYPVDGWWRLRPKLNRVESSQKFSLVVTIEVDNEAINIHSEVSNKVKHLSIPQRAREISSMFETPVEVSV